MGIFDEYRPGPIVEDGRSFYAWCRAKYGEERLMDPSQTMSIVDAWKNAHHGVSNRYVSLITKSLERGDSFTLVRRPLSQRELFARGIRLIFILDQLQAQFRDNKSEDPKA